MLSPSDLQAIANDITDIYSGVESECIKSIVQHLTAGKRVTQASVWQMKKLNDVGLLKRDLLTVVREKSGKAFPEVEKLVNEALRRSVGVDIGKIRKGLSEYKVGKVAERIAKAQQTEAFQKILKSAVAGCKDVMNLTGTRAVQASVKAYTDAVNTAYLEMVSGTYSYEDAVKRAVGRIGKSGIKIVDSKDKATGKELVKLSGEKYTTYKVGNSLRVYPLDSAIRRDITTAINRSCGHLTLETCGELGAELVETSWHVGARPEHEVWQGKVFSLDPKDTRYPYFYAPQEQGGTGYGDMLGLCGINCYHSFSPYFEGSTRATDEKKPTAEENEKAYREQQTQRAYERSLRGLKREQIAYREAGMVEEAKDAQRRINDMSSRYRQFLKDTGRTRVSMLDSVSGYHSISTKPATVIPKPSASAPRTPTTPRTPSAHVAPKVTPPTLVNLEKHQADYLARERRFYENFDDQKFDKVMKQAFSKGQPSMRIDKSVIEIITEGDGRFKTQFETGTSGGCLNASYRTKATNNMFNPTGTLAPSEHEKYGCLLPKNYREAFDSGIADWYGDSIVQFKDEVLERVTFTIGDSLRPAMDGEIVPSKATSISPSAVKKWLSRDFNPRMERALVQKSFKDISMALDGSYIELQYHGELTIDDIKSVCFSGRVDYLDSVIDKLKKRGIEVYNYRQGSVVKL